ncbi:Noggin-3, partial [Araneus ventricosus]
IHPTSAIMFKFSSLVIVSLLSSNLLSVDCTTTESYEDSLETTTSGTVFVHRRIPPRAPMGNGGRYSLINSRFNRRPKKKNLDPHQLLEILGNYYSPEWMSVDEPPALANKDPDRGATYVVRHDNWQHADLIKQLQASNLSVELAQMGGSKVLEEPLFVKTVEAWLLKRASCPVRYVWEDIGNLFWPRYIRRGECASVPGTCSWPPGMHCVPSGTTTLHVLRWQCKVPKGKGRRKAFKHSKDQKSREWPRKINEGEQPANLKCSWIRVPYPITNDCLCTC